MKNEVVVAVSGYFDPIHVGHLEYLQLASKLGDKIRSSSDLTGIGK